MAHFYSIDDEMNVTLETVTAIGSDDPDQVDEDKYTEHLDNSSRHINRTKIVDSSQFEKD